MCLNSPSLVQPVCVVPGALASQPHSVWAVCARVSAVCAKVVIACARKHVLHRLAQDLQQQVALFCRKPDGSHFAPFPIPAARRKQRRVRRQVAGKRKINDNGRVATTTSTTITMLDGCGLAGQQCCDDHSCDYGTCDGTTCMP